MGGLDSVGTLLAEIANLLSEGLRVLRFADKRHWGVDEHEQVRALDEALDDAKKDFQELGPLVNGQSNYEHDRRHESIEELRALCTKFEAHVQNLRGWARSGGPIDPIWVRDTQSLQRQLHRAQCRAAMRVFTSARESSERCLGAFLVHRNQRAPFNGGQVGSHAHATEYQRRCQAELMACRSVGTFQRFSEQDIAFVCDFCDGHMVWQDLERMPTIRSTQEAINTMVTPPSLSTNNSNWQATATIHSGEATKQIIFAPVVVANHIAPTHGDWEARLLCPLCEELAKQPQDEDDEEEAYHTHEEFPDVASLQEHIEWQHGTNMLPVTLPTPSTENCRIM